MWTFFLHRMASIKQLLGQLEEAVNEYTAVLQIEPSYVPALKGKSSRSCYVLLHCSADPLGEWLYLPRSWRESPAVGTSLTEREL